MTARARTETLKNILNNLLERNQTPQGARSSVRTEHRTFKRKAPHRNPGVPGSIPGGPAIRSSARLLEACERKSCKPLLVLNAKQQEKGVAGDICTWGWVQISPGPLFDSPAHRRLSFVVAWVFWAVDSLCTFRVLWKGFMEKSCDKMSQYATELCCHCSLT